MTKVRNSPKICFVCSAGGHFEEIRQLKDVINKYNHFFVLAKNNATKSFKDTKFLVNDLNRTNFLTKFFSFIRTFIRQFFIFLRQKPDYIITTGAAVAIPMCIIGKIFKKKIIYVESFARIKDLSRTGKMLLKKSDVFIVQWDELLDKYPTCVYGGKLF